MKVLSWNIRQGGGSRCKQILDYILKLNPEILILSEFRNNDKGLLIRKKLLEKSYLFQQSTGAKANVNSVLIASKISCNFSIFTSEIGDYPQAVVMADFEAFRLFGLYLPHKKKHTLFEFLIAELKKDKPAILAGDFNTGKNYIDQKGNSFWYTDSLLEMEEINYVDAFRHLYPDEKEFSWFSHQGNGYRYDHTWVHKVLTNFVEDCFYDQKVREENISDHAPMILHLKA